MKKPGEMVTLPDGRTFPAGSEIVRIYAEVQALHLARLRMIPDSAARRVYCEGVDRSEGIESGRALRAAYLEDRERRKANK